MLDQTPSSPVNTGFDLIFILKNQEQIRIPSSDIVEFQIIKQHIVPKYTAIEYTNEHHIDIATLVLRSTSKIQVNDNQIYKIMINYYELPDNNTVYHLDTSKYYQHHTNFGRHSYISLNIAVYPSNDLTSLNLDYMTYSKFMENNLTTISQITNTELGVIEDIVGIEGDLLQKTLYSLRSWLVRHNIKPSGTVALADTDDTNLVLTTTSIHDLNLATRPLNTLIRNNEYPINSVYDILNLTYEQLSTMRNFGTNSSTNVLDKTREWCLANGVDNYRDYPLFME